MGGRMITRGKFVFEVWNRSLCMREPFNSPTIKTFNDLNDEENMEKAIDEFIAIMNIGIDIYRTMHL